MAKVLQATVTPFYNQVLLTTIPAAECPEWVTGEEPGVASPFAIAISTVSDYGGGGPQVVHVEVWVDEAPPLDGWFEVLRAPVLVSAWGIAVQDVLASELHRTTIPPADYDATVYGRPVPRPALLLPVTFDQHGGVMLGEDGDASTTDDINDLTRAAPG